jgi:hypothetical protein
VIVLVQSLQYFANTDIEVTGFVCGFVDDFVELYPVIVRPRSLDCEGNNMSE